MSEQDILKNLVKGLSSVRTSTHGDRTIVSIPFTDYEGDAISIGVRTTGNIVLLDDLGNVAGMLFMTNQHTPDTDAFKMVKNLSEAYGIKMDFDSGLLVKEAEAKDMETMVNFCKVIASIQICAPFLMNKEAAQARLR